MKEIKTINLTEKFSRNQLYTYLRKDNPDLSKNSFKWVLADLRKKGLVYKLSSDTYSTKPDMKKQYKPFYSEKTSKLIDELGDFYPDVNFVVFETFLLNEFVNRPCHKFCVNGRD